MEINSFYDKRTNTLTYVLYDQGTRDAVVIDPVLDYDPQGSKLWTDSVDRVVDFVTRNDLRLHYIIETHAHADHLSAAQFLKTRFPDVKSAIGKNITLVQETFKQYFNLPVEFRTDGSQFDRLIDDNEVIEAGSLRIKALFTPGHTPACVTYQVEDAIFTGDTMFMPDMGTGRCDFPGGSADDLYDSITTRLYTLPDTTRVFVGHDYQPGGRELAFETTIGEQKQGNIQLPAGRSREEFVQFRRERDRQLAAPKLLFQSVQVNIDAGAIPDAEDNRKRYLKIPINAFRPDLEGELRREVV